MIFKFIMIQSYKIFYIFRTIEFKIEKKDDYFGSRLFLLFYTHLFYK